MQYISEKDLSLFLTRHNHRLTNSVGMQIGWSQASGAWTFFTLCSYDQSPLEISIATEEDSLTEFITGFQLHRIEDIDHLDYNSAWMRYLNGGAEIIVTPRELEASLSFRIVKSKTIIFSLDMHFYDEVPEHLTMPEDFDRYILENDKLLWAASNNRYKFSKR